MAGFSTAAGAAAGVGSDAGAVAGADATGWGLAFAMIAPREVVGCVDPTISERKWKRGSACE